MEASTIMEFTKIDSNTIEQTFKTTVFKTDLLSEKETLEARLKVVNEMIAALK